MLFCLTDKWTVDADSGYTKVWFLLRESQGFFAEVLNLSFVVEGFQGGEIDTLEDGFQGFLFVTFFLLFVENQCDALVERSLAMVVGFEFHGV